MNVSIPIVDDGFVEGNTSFFGKLLLFYFNFGNLLPFNYSQSVSLEPNETEITIIDDDGKSNFSNDLGMNVCYCLVSDIKCEVSRTPD